MKQLEQFDPSAIRSIELNIKYRKKYTSIFTIILSLSIIAFSVGMNYEVISQFWIPRSQLTVSSFRYQSSEQEFIDTPLCLVSPLNQTLNYSLLSYSKYFVKTNTYENTTIDTVSSLENFKYMEKYLTDKNYKCFNLKGIKLRYRDRLILNSTFNPNYSIYLGYANISTVLNQLNQSFLTFNFWQHSRGNPILLQMNVNTFEIYQKLSLSYQPTILHTFSAYQYNKTSTSSFRPTNQNIVFFFQFDTYFPVNYPDRNYIGYWYRIYRMNTAEIFASILSFRGLILVPLTIFFIFFPLSEKSYRFELVKARFESTLFKQRAYNLWTELKIKLAKCFSVKFAEEKCLEKAMERVDQQLDILRILQMQAIMRRQRSEFDQIERNQEDIFECRLLRTQNEDDIIQQKQEIPQKGKSMKSHKSVENNDGTGVVLEKTEEPKISVFISFLKSLIYYFDPTETQYEILTNQGKGYGSIWSICIFILLAAGIISSFTFLGIFSLKEDQTKNMSYRLQKQQFELQIPINSISINCGQRTRVPILKGALINKKGQILQQIRISNTDDCYNWTGYFPFPTYSNTRNWLCNQQAFKISSNLDRSEQIFFKLYFSNSNGSGTYYPSGSTTFSCAIAMMPNSPLYQNYPMRYQFTFPGACRIVSLKKIINKNNEQITNAFEVEKYQQVRRFDLYEYFIFKVSDKNTIIQKSTPSTFDIFDNAWAIGLLACNLLLFRIGRLINLSIIKSRGNSAQIQRRSDILTVLFDMDKFSKGLLKDQINSVPFYYKSKLPSKIR